MGYFPSNVLEKGWIDSRECAMQSQVDTLRCLGVARWLDRFDGFPGLSPFVHGLYTSCFLFHFVRIQVMCAHIGLHVSARGFVH